MKVSKVVTYIFILSIFLMLIFVFTVNISTSASTVQTQIDWWSMFHHDVAHTGSSTSSGPLTNQSAWSTQGSGFSSPSVVDGVVYVGFDAFNATSGVKLWTFTDSYNVSSTQYSPAIANGIVYVCTLNPHYAVMPSDDLYALNGTTGELLWNYTIYSSVAMMGNSWVYTSPNFSPAVNSGVVYAGSLALNASTGALLWNNQIGYYAVSSPAIVNGVDYISNHFGGFYALNASTGETIWRINADAQGSSPAVSGGVIYIHEDGIVQALSATTGKQLWNFSEGIIGNYSPQYYYPPSGISSPAVANGVLYVCGILGTSGGGGSPITYALNASSGMLLWNSTVGGDSSPAISNGVAYLGSYDGIYALNISTGEILWSYKTGNSVFSSPAVANGMVYAGSNNGALYAFGSPSTNYTPTPTPVPELTIWLAPSLIVAVTLLFLVLKKKQSKR
jgi:eukaryotic-like serine/threonine-protein kinase